LKDLCPIPVWKTLAAFCYLLVFFSPESRGQCAAGKLQSVTYDTLVPGTGNSTHTLSLSQFNPSLGTLVAAKINSVVSVNYGFTLQDVETVQRNFTVSVGRYDNITSPSIATPYTNLVTVDVGSFLLNPNQTVSKAPYTILYRYLNTDSFASNMVNFVGNGNVSFTYKPITYTTLTGSKTYYYSATASDTVLFSITYYYCNNITLAPLLSGFKAERQDRQTVELGWEASAEQPGRTYMIQKSREGDQFSDLQSIASIPELTESKYGYSYTIAPDEHRTLYFRLKIIEPNGETTYSDIKSVDMSDTPGSGVYLFPNPSDQFINIVFNQASPGNWIVQLFSADGKIFQTERFTSVTAAHLDFHHRIACGVYFARATQEFTHKEIVLKFVVK